MTRLILSPSQQEWNQYKGGGTGILDSEEHWMRQVAARVKARVDVQGWAIPVVVVNKGSWKANVAESNRLKATQHVALHSDAGGGHGTTVFHRTLSSKGKALATALYPFVSAASDKPDRGIKSSLLYGELNGPRAAAVIIEFAYHDNTAEAAEIRRSINEYAEAVVKGLARYYGKTYHPEAAAPVTPPTPTLPASITLKQGSRGNAVKTLQRSLAVYPANGAWGERMDGLVRRFQKARGMVPDGKVGSGGFAVMTSPPSFHGGNASKFPEWVPVVQRLVGVKDDGKWGDGTEAAVITAQRKHGLKGDGWMHPETWAVLTKREK